MSQSLTLRQGVPSEKHLCACLMALALVQGAGSLSRTVSGSPGGARRAAGNSPPLAPGGPAWPGMLGVEIMAPAHGRDGGIALKGGQDGQSLL